MPALPSLADRALEWAASLQVPPSASLRLDAGEDTWIRIDGDPAQPAAGLELSLAPGRHELVLGRPGSEPRAHTLRLAAGEERVLDVGGLLENSEPQSRMTVP